MGERSLLNNILTFTSPIWMARQKKHLLIRLLIAPTNWAALWPLVDPSVHWAEQVPMHRYLTLALLYDYSSLNAWVFVTKLSHLSRPAFSMAGDLARFIVVFAKHWNCNKKRQKQSHGKSHLHKIVTNDRNSHSWMFRLCVNVFILWESAHCKLWAFECKIFHSWKWDKRKVCGHRVD